MLCKFYTYTVSIEIESEDHIPACAQPLLDRLREDLACWNGPMPGNGKLTLTVDHGFEEQAREED